MGSITATSTSDIFTTPYVTINTATTYEDINRITAYYNTYETNINRSITFEPFDTLKIIKVEMLSPNKVMRFTFADKTVIKTVCNEEDDFDLEYAFYIAYAKKMYGKDYTIEGIEHKAEELSYQKKFVKYVKNGMKVYEKGLQEKAEAERKKQEEKNKRIRDNLKRQRKNAKVKEKRIEEMTEAIRRTK